MFQLRGQERWWKFPNQVIINWKFFLIINWKLKLHLHGDLQMPTTYDWRPLTRENSQLTPIPYCGNWNTWICTSIGFKKSKIKIKRHIFLQCTVPFLIRSIFTLYVFFFSAFLQTIFFHKCECIIWSFFMTYEILIKSSWLWWSPYLNKHPSFCWKQKKTKRKKKP